MRRLSDRSRMSGDVHVRFCEGLGVKLPRPTRLILIHRDKDYLKSLIAPIRNYLSSHLNLELHPDKVYLQHYSKGVKYLGAVIKPHRIYIAKRTKGNFYKAIQDQNNIIRDHKPDTEERDAFLSSMNSYLGIMKHYRTYNIRQKTVTRNLSGWWWNYCTLCRGAEKFVLKGTG